MATDGEDNSTGRAKKQGHRAAPQIETESEMSSQEAERIQAELEEAENDEEVRNTFFYPLSFLIPSLSLSLPTKT